MHFRAFVSALFVIKSFQIKIFLAFASCLVFGYTGKKRPIHVVCSFDGEYIHFITAYEPDTIKFYSDLKTIRRNI